MHTNMEWGLVVHDFLLCIMLEFKVHIFHREKTRKDAKLIWLGLINQNMNS